MTRAQCTYDHFYMMSNFLPVSTSKVFEERNRVATRLRTNLFPPERDQEQFWFEPSQVKSLYDAAESAFKSPIHILVNSAGVLDAKYPTVADTTVEDFDRVYTRGSFLCSKEAANRLKLGGGGRIILLTSSLTRSLKPGFAAYAASKAAVETMVKILAKELKGTGITSNCVAPGPIAAESPFGRHDETKDVVPLVGFLALDGNEWVNGQIIPINVGYE